MSGWRLGVDYGTSNTVAALRRPDERIDLLLFDGSPLLPSGAFVTADGSLLTGRDAVYSARAQPDRFEPAPKRCIDDGAVLIGERAVPVVNVIGASLRRVRQEAEAVSAGPVDDLVLTYPASWGPRRRQILIEACACAELPAPILLAEPVAAAQYYTAQAAITVRPGRRYLVYDLGAGTFDAAVVQATASGFTVLATSGLSDTGGLDIDATIMAHIGAVYAERAPGVWQPLEQPADAAQQRLSRQLWDDIRAAKEMLSRTSATFVHIPGSDIEIPLGREQLDRIAAPVLRRTVLAVHSLLRDSVDGESAAADVALLLVGGASRMPLVATLLHRQLGRAPDTAEQPELVVALGAVAGPGTARTPAPAPQAAQPMLPRAATATAAVTASGPAVPVSTPIGTAPRRPRQDDASRTPGRQPLPPAPALSDDQPRRSRPGAAEPTGAEGHAHLLYLTLPAVEGYTTRRYQKRWWNRSSWVDDDPTFLERDGRLLLFAQPGSLVAHLRAAPSPALRIDPDWLDAVEQTIADLEPPHGAPVHHPIRGLVEDTDHVDLDLARYSAEGGPGLWAAELLVPARNLAAELAYALDLDLADLLDETGPIDRLDDLLRISGPRSLLTRRRTRALNPAQVAADWLTLIDAIEAAITPMPPVRR